MEKEKLYGVRKAGLIKIKGPLTAKAHNPHHPLPYVRLRSANLTRS